MGWDRAAEELTWERLLGLDGSLIFLEHVFWVVSLNTLFVLIFGKFELIRLHMNFISSVNCKFSMSQLWKKIVGIVAG